MLASHNGRGRVVGAQLRGPPVEPGRHPARRASRNPTPARAERRRAARAAARAETRARASGPDGEAPDTATTATNNEVEALARAVGLGRGFAGGRITEIGITGPGGNETVTRAEDPAPELP